VRLALVAVGRLKAGPERELAARYVGRYDAVARRIGLGRLEIREIDESRRARAEDRKADEAQAVRAALEPGSRLLLLDPRGRALDSPSFAATIAGARDAGAAALTLVVGGPDGVAEELRQAAQLLIAFGAMTWPHQLVRVMLAEQIYRAATILAGHPYHRA
jgi:23S rRNA (pseudouridine1915-N3)-methyltransferase